MTTSQENTFLSDVLSGDTIPQAKMSYFRGRLANRFHALVLEEFSRLESEGKISRADLARRISREPAQITRWLGTSGNWTFDTLSDLLLGMGCEPALSIANLRQSARPEAAVEAALAERFYTVPAAGTPAANEEFPIRANEQFGGAFGPVGTSQAQSAARS